jgi:hypothetical protein
MQAQADKPTTTLIAARVPVEIVDRFVKIAAGQDRTFSAELRRAMREHLAQNDGGRPGRRPTVESSDTPEPNGTG